MFLALKEMRRAKGRFGLLMGAVGLLVFLILFQQSLQNGLITAFIGAVRNQSAPVLAFSVDGRRNLQGSVVVPTLEQAIVGADGVGRSGRIGQGTFTVRAGGQSRNAAIIGYQAEGLGSPTTMTKGRLPARDGEAVASEADASAGFDVGDTVVLDPGGVRLAIVGLARDVQIGANPTMFTTYRTYQRAVAARNPDAKAVLPSVIALEPAVGVTPEQLVANVNAASPDADALTRAQAAADAPGVSQVRTSFTIVFLLYGLVVPFVTGLFFLIVTFQKAASLTLLRAIGAPSRRLVRSLLYQVVVVVGAGLAIGVGLYLPLTNRSIGGIPLRFETRAVLFWSVLLLAFSLLSSLVSARRVLQIDPLDATTGASVGM